MRRLAVTSLPVVLPCLLAAGDLTGIWIGTLPRSGRTPSRDIAIQLEQRGTALAGKVYNAAGTSDPIISGTVSDGRVQFEVEARQQAGNQINIVRYRFDGTFDGECIELIRELAAARDALSGTVVPVRRAWDSDDEDRKRRFHTVRLEALIRQPHRPGEASTRLR